MAVGPYRDAHELWRPGENLLAFPDWKEGHRMMLRSRKRRALAFSEVMYFAQKAADHANADLRNCFLEGTR